MEPLVFVLGDYMLSILLAIGEACLEVAAIIAAAETVAKDKEEAKA